MIIPWQVPAICKLALLFCLVSSINSKSQVTFETNFVRLWNELENDNTGKISESPINSCNTTVMQCHWQRTFDAYYKSTGLRPSRRIGVKSHARLPEVPVLADFLKRSAFCLLSDFSTGAWGVGAGVGNFFRFPFTNVIQFRILAPWEVWVLRDAAIYAGHWHSVFQSVVESSSIRGHSRKYFPFNVSRPSLKGPFALCAEASKIY